MFNFRLIPLDRIAYGKILLFRIEICVAVIPVLRALGVFYYAPQGKSNTVDMMSLLVDCVLLAINLNVCVRNSVRYIYVPEVCSLLEVTLHPSMLFLQRSCTVKVG